MAPMRLVFSKQSAKKLRMIQPKVAEAIFRELDRIARDPFAPHSNVERLQGAKNAFRLRHGDWRIPCVVDVHGQAVKVAAVAGRGEVYKR
ncbi:MAG: type II toxin-antitoxin system RelE/ParE family toxin [Rhodospirillales bacterium]|nr:type II toxin-antitoxin system RelE/ParE family toxin [Rhodospirillales bacterium]